jgi:hypothetical protein
VFVAEVGASQGVSPCLGRRLPCLREAVKRFCSASQMASGEAIHKAAKAHACEFSICRSDHRVGPCARG